MRLPLVEVAPQSDVPIGEGEDGFGLRQRVEVESLFADAPFLDGEGRMFTHCRPPSSLMLEMTISAPKRSMPMKTSAVFKQMAGARFKHKFLLEECVPRTFVPLTIS